MEELEGEKVRYIRGYRNRIIASDCESARQYYHYACDELGSVTHVIIGCGDGECGQRQDERIQNTYEYDAFGNRTQCEEKVPNRFCFAGEQYDAVTQQYYLRARFYNPVIGRFTQEDSYHGDGLNLYAYCHNNPMYYVDPSGHDVRAAAEKDFVNKALDAMNGYADKGIDAMMKEVYGSSDGPGPDGGSSPVGSGSRPDFYVTPSGDVVPSTAYRYMDSKYAAQTIGTKSAPGSYFGFEKFDSAGAAQDAFQIAPEWSNCKLRGEFDTLQVLDEMYVPKAYGDKGPGLEPFTCCYPEYGKGGQQQYIYKGTIEFTNVDIIGD